MGGKPWQDRERIETHYLTARNHVTLDPQTCSTVETALFEVESIAARTLHGSERGQPARLAGGLWHSTPQLAGRSKIGFIADCCWAANSKSGWGESSWRNRDVPAELR